VHKVIQFYSAFSLYILAYVLALCTGEVKDFMDCMDEWIAWMNGIEQCIHGDVIFKEH